MVPAVLSPPNSSLKACEHYETIVSIVSNPPKEVIKLYTSLDDAFALFHRAVAGGGRREVCALTPASDSWRACTLWWCLPREIREKCSSPEALAKCAPGEMFRVLGKEATRLDSSRLQAQRQPGESEEDSSYSASDSNAPRRIFTSPSEITEAAPFPRTVFAGSTRPRAHETPEAAVEQRARTKLDRLSRSRERTSRRGEDSVEASTREGGSARAEKRRGAAATPSTPDLVRRRVSRSRSGGRREYPAYAPPSRGGCFHCNSMEHTIGGCQWWSDRRAADSSRTRVCPKCLAEGHGAALCKESKGALWGKGPGPTTAGWRRGGREGREGSSMRGDWSESINARRTSRHQGGGHERYEGTLVFSEKDRRHGSRDSKAAASDGNRNSRYF